MDVEFLVLIETVSKLDPNSPLPESFWNSTTNKVKAYLLPEQSYGEDRPSEEKDFVEHRINSLTGLKALLSLLEKLDTLSSISLNKNFVVWSLLLCGEHTSDNLWTTSECIEVSSKCLELLKSMNRCKSISELLCRENKAQQYSRPALLALRPKLLKDTWRKYPAAVCCYQWILLQIKVPYLSDQLNTVFPTALIILDDHVPSRRLIGLTCITHILQNVPRTETVSQGLDNVLYHTLKPLLFLREPLLVTPIYNCMITLLASTEQGYTRSVATGEWSRLESTLVTLLQNMRSEDRLVLRLAYVQCLESLLKAMGPSVIQLSKTLLSVFEEYLDKQTPDARHCALLAFETYIYNSKERLPSNAEKIMYLLLRTLYDLTKEINLCEICSQTPLSVYLELTEKPIRSNDVGKCSTHPWSDVEVVVKCIEFIKSCVPNQFDLIRSDVREKVIFNPLLEGIVKIIF